jgi:hypothetical protein
MRPKPAAPLSPTREEQSWARLYEGLMTRYNGAPEDWFVTMTAVRIYAKRVGLDNLLKLLVKHGTPMVAERCRHELTLRQEYFARMMAKYPPEDQREADGAVREMAEDLAIIDSPDGALRLLRFLDRLRTRELLLQSGNHKVTH